MMNGTFGGIHWRHDLDECRDLTSLSVTGTMRIPMEESADHLLVSSLEVENLVATFIYRSHIYIDMYTYIDTYIYIIIMNIHTCVYVCI